MAELQSVIAHLVGAQDYMFPKNARDSKVGTAFLSLRAQERSFAKGEGHDTRSETIRVMIVNVMSISRDIDVLTELARAYAATYHEDYKFGYDKPVVVQFEEMGDEITAAASRSLEQRASVGGKLMQKIAVAAHGTEGEERDALRLLHRRILVELFSMDEGQAVRMTDKRV